MSKKAAYYGCSLAFAIIMGYIEFLIPFNFSLPGVKLGIANIIVVFLLYKSGAKPAITINVLRILLSGILFGSVLSIFYSLFGGILSFLVMVVVKKSNRFGIIGVSVVGGITHNIGQIIAASITLVSFAPIYYLPVLLLLGTLCGFIVGMVSGIIIRTLKTFKI